MDLVTVPLCRSTTATVPAVVLVTYATERVGESAISVGLPVPTGMVLVMPIVVVLTTLTLLSP